MNKIKYISPDEKNISDNLESKIKNNINKNINKMNKDINTPDNAFKISLPRKNNSKLQDISPISSSDSSTIYVQKPRVSLDNDKQVNCKQSKKYCPKKKKCHNKCGNNSSIFDIFNRNKYDNESSDDHTNCIVDEDTCNKYNDVNYELEEIDECEKNLERAFYILYKTKEKCKGCLAGCIEGSGLGFYCGLKFAGAGGWIVGGFAQFFGLFIGPFFAIPVGGLLGLAMDKEYIMQFSRDFRYAGAAGGLPPTHGSLT